MQSVLLFTAKIPRPSAYWVWGDREREILYNAGPDTGRGRLKFNAVNTTLLGYREQIQTKQLDWFMSTEIKSTWKNAA